MIEWITNEKNKAVIYQTEQTIKRNVSNLTVIKQLCISHLFTYDGYLKATKKVFDYHYRIPLYISDDIQLIATRRVRDYENIWINYASIVNVTYDKNRINITFTSYRKLTISMTPYAWKQQINRLNEIKLYISKHFHTSFYRK